MLFNLIAFSLFGGVMNRIRGGWLNIPANGILNALFFGLILGLVLGLPYWQWAALSVAMFLGQTPGWGRYIGAAGGWETQELVEWKPVDFLIKPLKELYEEELAKGYEDIAYYYKVMWGVFGLTFRGMYWGALISIASLSLWPLIAGSFMGIIYKICLTVTRATDINDNWKGRGWEAAEVGFGIWLWGHAFLGLIS